MNAIINTMLLRLQEVPGVLTCCHRFISVPEGGLDPWIAAYIANADLERLLRVPNIDLDYALIRALVKRWQPKTHSFHLPHSEMTITLQDMEVIIGVPVDGLPVMGFTHMQDCCDLYIELLGHRPPNRQVDACKNTAVMEGLGVKAKWLKERFSNPFSANTTEVLV